MMRISVVIPDDLSQDLEQCRRQEGRSTSQIVRDSLTLYLRVHRRQAAGEALKQIAQEFPLAEDQVKKALSELEDERGRSDRL